MWQEAPTKHYFFVRAHAAKRLETTGLILNNIIIDTIIMFLCKVLISSYYSCQINAGEYNISLWIVV